MSKKAPVGAQPVSKKRTKGSGEISPTSRTRHRVGVPFSAFGVPKALLAATCVRLFLRWSLMRSIIRR